MLGAKWDSIVAKFFKAAFEVSNRGTTGLGVFIQDQTTGVLAVPFLQTLSTPTLASDTVVGSRTITLSPGHGLLSPANDGDIVELADPLNGSFFTQCEIVAGGVVGDVITLDCPVNRIYLSATALVAVSDKDMNVDGSVTPVVFSVLPFTAQKGDMVRIICEMRDEIEMDFTTFGGQPALVNGLLLRINNGDGTFRNLYNFKSNGDVIEQCFDHAFLQPKQGNTIKGFTARLTWGGQSKHGVVIRLDGALNESLEFIVQDDLTAVEFKRMHWSVQGHEIQD